MMQIIKKIEAFPAYLKSRIIGQDHVIDAFLEKISYAERGITNPNRPKGCFFLLGPTGTGKTELVRETIKYLYGSPEKNLLRLDMSEFGETAGEDVGKRLIGYNAEEPGRLYHFLESTTEGGILYDEFEKANPDLAKYMLQQLDAGRTTLWNNKSYNLQNYYLFFTSNVAAGVFQGNTHISIERKVDAAVNELKRRFKSPEFVARFGKFNYGILAFKSLEMKHLRLIAHKFIKDELLRLANVKQTSPKHPDNLIVKGYDPLFTEFILLQTNTTLNGAREIRDVVERNVYQLYCNTFDLQRIGQDISGFINMDKNKPVVIDEPPANHISL